MKKRERRSTLTRRQFLVGAGLGAGALAVGGGAFLAGRQGSAPSGSAAAYRLEAAPMDLEIGGRRVST